MVKYTKILLTVLQTRSLSGVTNCYEKRFFNFMDFDFYEDEFSLPCSEFNPYGDKKRKYAYTQDKYQTYVFQESLEEIEKKILNTLHGFQRYIEYNS